MSQQAAKRRRSQAKNNYMHLCAKKRPVHRRAVSLSVQDAITREKAKAQRMANARKPK